MMTAGRIEELREEALTAVAAAKSTADLEQVRVKYLGRSAELTEIKKSIGSLPPEQRKAANRAFEAWDARLRSDPPPSDRAADALILKECFSLQDARTQPLLADIFETYRMHIEES